MRFPQTQTCKDELALLPEKGRMKEKKGIRSGSKSIKKIAKIASFMQSKKRSNETGKKETSSKKLSQNTRSSYKIPPSSAYPLSRSRRQNLEELQIESPKQSLRERFKGTSEVGMEAHVKIIPAFIDSEKQTYPLHFDPGHMDEISCIGSEKEPDQNANDRSDSTNRAVVGVIPSTGDVPDVDIYKLANATAKERSLDDNEFISAEMIWQDPPTFFESEDLASSELIDSTSNEEESSPPTATNRVEPEEGLVVGSDLLVGEDPEIEVALPVHGSILRTTPILLCGASGEHLRQGIVIQERDMKQDERNEPSCIDDDTSPEKKRRKAKGKSPFAILKLRRKITEQNLLGGEYETRDMGPDERHAESKEILSAKTITSKKRANFFPFMFGPRVGTKQSHRKKGKKKNQDVIMCINRQGSSDTKSFVPNKEMKEDRHIDANRAGVESNYDGSNKSISMFQCHGEPQTLSSQRETSQEDSIDERSGKEQDKAPDKTNEVQIDGNKVDAEAAASFLQTTAHVWNRKNLFALFSPRGGGITSHQEPEIDDRHEVPTDQESEIDSDEYDESVDDSCDDFDKRPEDWVLQEAYFAMNLAATDLLTEFGCGACCRVGSFPNTTANAGMQPTEGSSDLETGLRDALQKILKDRDYLIVAQAQEIEQLRSKKKSLNEGKFFKPLSSLRKSVKSVKSLLARKKNQ